MTFLKPYEILLRKAETDLQGAEVLYKSDNEFLDVEIVFFPFATVYREVFEGYLII